MAPLGANLLNLKPCIEVRDGKMQVVKKYRGLTPSAWPARQRPAGWSPELRRDRLFITYTPVEPGLSGSGARLWTGTATSGEVFRNLRRVTVSCHCGPGTLGVLFIRQ